MAVAPMVGPGDDRDLMITGNVTFDVTANRRLAVRELADLDRFDEGARERCP